MSNKVSFIGSGNMGGALIRAVCRNIGGERVSIFDTDITKAGVLAEETGCRAYSSAEEAIFNGEYVVFCVKPQILGEVIKGLDREIAAPPESGKRIVISIAAGVSIESVAGFMPVSGKGTPIIRIMPNLAAGVGEGMTLAVTNSLVSDEDYNEFAEIFRLTGEIVRTDEKSLDMGTAISGCGPAFTAMFIEALADGGVEIGLSRDMSLKLAIQTVKGAAQMLSVSGMHPGEFKDAVCSPGGSTIAGVASLERQGFRAAAAQAVVASNRRNIELGES